MTRQVAFVLSIIIIVSLCCVGCGGAAEPTQPSEAVFDPVPDELVGTWSSADGGQLDMTETFTFGSDGTLTASAVFRGTQTQTVGGSFTVSGHTLECVVDDGVGEPYQVTFDYRVDGRELLLTDDEGTSRFLRVS